MTGLYISLESALNGRVRCGGTGVCPSHGQALCRRAIPERARRGLPRRHATICSFMSRFMHQAYIVTLQTPHSIPMALQQAGHFHESVTSSYASRSPLSRLATADRADASKGGSAVKVQGGDSIPAAGLEGPTGVWIFSSNSYTLFAHDDKTTAFLSCYSHSLLRFISIATATVLNFHRDLAFHRIGASIGRYTRVQSEKHSVWGRNNISIHP